MNSANINPNDTRDAMLDSISQQLKDPSKPLSLLVRFRVKPGDANTVCEAFDEARTATIQEPGCVLFDIHSLPGDAGEFVVYEQWRSLESLSQHFTQDYFFKLRDTFGALLIAPPHFEVMMPSLG